MATFLLTVNHFRPSLRMLRKIYYDKYVLSVHALIFKNYSLILKILPVTRFKGTKAAILTLKMLTGSRL
jgi:hypothetical protein